MERSFAKKLNNVDVERRLLLPENCIEDFARGHEAYLKFEDEDGQVWTFLCRVSPGGRSKPALHGDWFSFVRKKDLKVGDVIVIAIDREKDEVGGGQFNIKVRKTPSTRSETSSMGECITADLEE